MPQWRKCLQQWRFWRESSETTSATRQGENTLIKWRQRDAQFASPAQVAQFAHRHSGKNPRGQRRGYEQWAKVFNLKQAAKTLVFLQEQGIDSYDDLKRKTVAAADEFEALSTKNKDGDKKLKDIAELQKQIGTYGKTRAGFDAYKKSGYDRAYYDANAADIILHRAAKKFFYAQGFLGKLPSINQLKQDYAATLAEKKKLYIDYHRLHDSSKELAVAKANADRLLDIAENTTNRNVSRTNLKRDSHER
ncbi:MAG: hypothetical protein LBU32_11855 [Clostridiales bacterium]|jgi:hypothetical protein|nr:hypothetical protein [Clostridiales bacterium]